MTAVSGFKRLLRFIAITTLLPFFSAARQVQAALYTAVRGVLNSTGLRILAYAVMDLPPVD